MSKRWQGRLLLRVIRALRCRYLWQRKQVALGTLSSHFLSELSQLADAWEACRGGQRSQGWILTFTFLAIARYVLMHIMLPNNVSNSILRTPIGDDLLISAELLSNRVVRYGRADLYWLGWSQIGARGLMLWRLGFIGQLVQQSHWSVATAEGLYLRRLNIYLRKWFPSCTTCAVLFPRRRMFTHWYVVLNDLLWLIMELVWLISWYALPEEPLGLHADQSFRPELLGAYFSGSPQEALFLLTTRVLWRNLQLIRLEFTRPGIVTRRENHLIRAIAVPRR